ncbi:MAG: hydrogenase maturation nickel metallochaperone HypA [Nitrosomonas sp. PRO4]|nr:hydrogenase maturation nickel metallochaperone HypA [Nitrosomonas sp. PRO4]
MHEMSLAENIVQLIEEAACQQSFTLVKTVWLEIGQLACVEQASLRFYFEVLTQNSIACQAKLEIIEIAGQALCSQCQVKIPIASYHEACPYCSGCNLQITAGDCMRIKELEVA